MKYLAAALPLLFGDEIISIICLNVIAWMFVFDLLGKVASKKW